MAGKNSNKDTYRYIGLATQMMITLGLGVYAGYKLDEKTGWKIPIFIIILPLIALGISLWQLIKAFNKPKK